MYFARHPSSSCLVRSTSIKDTRVGRSSGLRLLPALERLPAVEQRSETCRSEVACSGFSRSVPRRSQRRPRDGFTPSSLLVGCTSAPATQSPGRDAHRTHLVQHGTRIITVTSWTSKRQAPFFSLLLFSFLPPQRGRTEEGRECLFGEFGSFQMSYRRGEPGRNDHRQQSEGL
jgi:hypothetical protein